MRSAPPGHGPWVKAFPGGAQTGRCQNRLNAMRILLISNSGRPFLEHARPHLADFLAGVERLAFVTAASLTDEAGYHERARAALAPPPPAGLGLDVLHLRWDARPLETLERAQAVFVGGGNTYALLKRLRQAGLLDPIRARARAGMPYVGSSAGSNVAGPRILTTHDWYVVGLDVFDALGLVPFNVNPHYLETDPAMAPGSETRDDRIREYHLVWDNPVAGIEEGTLIRVEAGVAMVVGRNRVKLFRRGEEPRWFHPGEHLPV